MTYLSNSTQSSLQQAFYENNMTLNIKSDCIIAEDSYPYTKEKIQKIIEIAGFCPLISENKNNNNFVFTVTPCKIPDYFEENFQDLQSSEQPPVLIEMRLQT